MFTGIIEAIGKIVEKNQSSLTVERPVTFHDIHIGSSICVAGACLSVVDFDDATMRFDITPETWKKTNLGMKAPDDRVNFERALKADSRFEGHVVQGHVEGVGNVSRSRMQDEDNELTIELPSDLTSFVVPKGSIAIDGVSLTIVSLRGSKCTIALIPHTLTHTTLGDLTVGDSVNIETDILGRYFLSH